MPKEEKGVEKSPSEILLESFLEDPRVISAKDVDGVFQIETIAGNIKFEFKKEGGEA